MRGRRPSPLDDSGAIGCHEASKARQADPRGPGLLTRLSSHRPARTACVRYLRSPPRVRGCGGIGRRARFRSVSGQPGGGSSPLIRIAESACKSPVLVPCRARALGFAHGRNVVIWQMRPSVRPFTSPLLLGDVPRGAGMSVRRDRGAWEVRWRDGSGRRRARRFKDEQSANAFDEALSEVAPVERRSDTATYGSQGGVYPYPTAQGTRLALPRAPLRRDTDQQAWLQQPESRAPCAAGGR